MHDRTVVARKTEGLSEGAIFLLAAGHDFLAQRANADTIADVIRMDVALWGLEPEDVWPNGRPERWLMEDCASRAAADGYTTGEEIEWWLGMFGCTRHNPCGACAAHYELVAS